MSLPEAWLSTIRDKMQGTPLQPFANSASLCRARLCNHLPTLQGTPLHPNLLTNKLLIKEPTFSFQANAFEQNSAELVIIWQLGPCCPCLPNESRAAHRKVLYDADPSVAREGQ